MPVARIAAPLVAAVALCVGCDAFRSDSENFARRRAAERAAAVAAMRTATAQTPKGAPVAGDALRALVADRTHVSVYETSPGGRHERYVEWAYFRPDGHFVYRNTAWATAPDGMPGDAWRVDGARLCILNQTMAPAERCFTIALTPAGAVQYYVDDPGDAAHGLLTRVVTIVQAGPPQDVAR